MPCLSESADVSLGAEARDPVFLELLCFCLQQLLLDLIADLGQVLRLSAPLLFDFHDVVIVVELDDAADPANGQVKSYVLERAGQRLSLNPSPIASQIARAVLGIDL